MPNASLRAWNGTMPVPGIDVFAQDLLRAPSAATSSMSMPPAALAMTTGHADARSITMLRYSSRSICSPSSISTRPTFLPSGAGLVGDQRHADHLLGELLGFAGGLGELDAAALAAAAGVNLRLDDGDVAAEPPRDLAGFR